MSFRVELTGAAAKQAEVAAAWWWRANRPDAPDDVDAELAHALDVLARMAPKSQPWAEIEGKTV